MWLMLQQPKPEDFVIASGKSYSVKEFLEIAFSHLNLDYKDYVVIDENLYRPSEVNVLQGDASKARKQLGWVPTVSFETLIKEMVDTDLKWHSATKGNPLVQS
jgi:GDPmannose 4,6-dehydratase